MQDNLEFLQWSKRYWDQYYPGGDYDAVARRKAAGPGATPSMPQSSGRMSSGGGTAPAARRPAPSAAPAARPVAGARTGGGSSAGSGVLQQKNAELMETVQGLERERDFYFSKLRDIELLIQQAMEADPALEEDEGSLLKQIQTILYSTEVRVANNEGPGCQLLISRTGGLRNPSGRGRCGISGRRGDVLGERKAMCRLWSRAARFTSSDTKDLGIKRLALGA